MTPELAAAIAAADTKARLEDLCLPYKPKRRTKAQIAREAGLEPLALGLLGNPQLVPEQAAAAYVDSEKGHRGHGRGARGRTLDPDGDALRGCRARWRASSAGVGTWRVAIDGRAGQGRGCQVLRLLQRHRAGEERAAAPRARAAARAQGRDPAPQHRAARRRGSADPTEPERRIAAKAGIAQKGRPADAWLAETVRWTWKVRLLAHLETEAEERLREQAEAEAIRVFGRNLHDLLLAAPAGQRTTIGLDPGLRTGVKVAVVDGTGKVLDAATVYPHEPRKDWEGTLRTLAALCARHGVQLVSIGNGTASRETDALAGELIKRHPELALTKVMVSEAGASVYSASEAVEGTARPRCPLRGAVSIARRLQDPLAELVRIEPKAIGVGQYQHDLNQAQLAKQLDAVVEDCVNAVGADLNTASAPPSRGSPASTTLWQRTSSRSAMSTARSGTGASS